MFDLRCLRAGDRPRRAGHHDEPKIRSARSDRARRILLIGDPANLYPAKGERPRHRGGKGRAHQGCADEKGIGMRCQPLDIGARRDARFRDDYAVRRDEAGQPFRDREIDGQIAEALFLGLDQHIHAKRVRRRQHRPRLVVVQHREHGEHRIRAISPRLRDLAGIDHEILGEDRSAEHCPHRRQIRQRAAEKGPVGEHADRLRGAPIGARLLRRIDAGPDRALGGRSLLHLHDEARARAGERRAQAAGGRHRARRTAREPRRDLDALARDDFSENAARFSHC